MDILDLKDPYTQGHSHHVHAITEKIYDCLPHRYQTKIDKTKLLLAALLHDIGKLYGPVEILHKNGGLNAEERVKESYLFQFQYDTQAGQIKIRSKAYINSPAAPSEDNNGALWLASEAANEKNEKNHSQGGLPKHPGKEPQSLPVLPGL